MACKVQVKVYDEEGRRVYMREVKLKIADLDAGVVVDESLDFLEKEYGADPEPP